MPRLRSRERTTESVKDWGGEDGAVRTPAMLAKRVDHVWTLLKWVKRPAVPFA